METVADIGVVGLGALGCGMALSFAERGWIVAVHDQNSLEVDRLVFTRAERGMKFMPCHDLADLAAAIRKPAAILTTLPAGEAMDDAVRRLIPCLDRGDMVVEAGVAFYKDTLRRAGLLSNAGIEAADLGIHGEAEAFQRGPGLAVGGSKAAYRRIEPILTSVASQLLGRPSSALVGPVGSGQYVRMVQDGIEYIDMQLLAESYSLMRDLMGMGHNEIREVLADWASGQYSSRLIEISRDIMEATDFETGRPLIDVILDAAEQGGTGKWCAGESIDLASPFPCLPAAVDARLVSMLKRERMAAADVLTGPKASFSGNPAGFVEEIGSAVYSARLSAYSQAFHLLAAASRRHDWGMDILAIAEVWRGGATIRSRLLQRASDAYRRNPEIANLLIDPYFAETTTKNHAAWRRVVAAAVGAGLPVPVLSAALAYYDSYRSAKLPASLIQAQRDYLGAHTYKRVDEDGDFHTEWTRET